MEFIKHVIEGHKQLDIYPIGDLHIGSPLHDKNALDRWLEDVIQNDDARVVLLGDMIDNGLKMSKSNVYTQTMKPSDQKRELANILRPIKDKILGCVSGNHESRSLIEVDDCPMYDVMAKLDLEDLYRTNLGFIKLSFGSRKKDPNQKQVYTIGLHHGASKSKVDKFKYAIDGLDILFSGHTHTPAMDFPAKIVLDTRNESIKMVDFTNIVVSSFTTYGDYVAKGMYMPNSGTKYPVVMLNGSEKEVKVLWK